MYDIIEIVLLLSIFVYLMSIKREAVLSNATIPDRVDGGRAPDARTADELRRIHDRLDRMQASLERVSANLGELQKDHDILDELEENVMEEWSRIIEEKLGKRPIMVPCPNCGSNAGLEPNLLADEDHEYGCTKCGAIIAVETLRETYPDAGI